MTDLYRKPNSGDRLRIPAPFYGQVVDTVLRSLGDHPAINTPDASPVEAEEVMIVNGSGNALARFSVVGLGTGSLVITPALDLVNFQNLTVANSASPDPLLPFGIIQEPVSVNVPVRTLIHGPTKCQVNFTTATDQWAAPAAANYTNLVSQAHPGPARILDNPSNSTGVQWAWVLLGNQSDQPLTFYVSGFGLHTFNGVSKYCYAATAQAWSTSDGEWANGVATCSPASGPYLRELNGNLVLFPTKVFARLVGYYAGQPVYEFDRCCSKTLDEVLEATGGNHYLVHSTDAFLKGAFTKPHTTDALVAAVKFLTHTTNAYRQLRKTRRHATNAYKRRQSTNTHTTNALLKAFLSAQHTTDSLLQSFQTVTHTTNGFTIIQFALTHTTDSLIQSVSTKTHTTDSYLAASGGSQTFTASGNFTATATATHTFRAYGAGQGGTDSIGSGGAGGHFAEGTIALTINDVVSITVATGGAHGFLPTVPGDTSAVKAPTTVVLAYGGGSIDLDIGSLTRIGGTGGMASISAGGGGGGCAGTSAAGTNGSAASGGTGGAGGAGGGGSAGAGGAGGDAGVDGVAGNAVGGGGGGGGSTHGGADGYRGQVEITW